MEAAASAFIGAVLKTHPIPPGLTVEIGGRNGSVRSLFPAPYVSIDLVDRPGVDLVADGSTWDPRGPVSCVVCCDVLAQTPAAAAICQHVFQILTPAGLLLLTAAGTGHEPPATGAYFAPLDASTLARWLRDFHDIVIIEETELHHIYALARKGQPDE